MRFGLIASVMLHVAILFGGVALLPRFTRLPDVAPEPYIPLDLIREAELALKTNIPAAAPKPDPVIDDTPDLPEPKEEEPAAPKEEAPKLPEPKVEEPEPDPEPAPKPEVKKEPVPEKKPEPPKEKPKPKPKSDELDFDALSQLIDREKKKEQTQPSSQTPSQTTEEAERARSGVGTGDKLTASDEAKMRAAIQQCWNSGVIIGAPEPEKLVVVIDFELNRDGTLTTSPRVANELQINLSGNQFWRVAQREAVSAVVKCAPYDFLPQERYETWKEFRLNFDPSQMVGR